MQQAVRAAQVNECAEVGHILHGSLHSIAGLNSCKQLFLHLGLLGHQKLLSVADDPSSLRIEFRDHKLDLLPRILGQISLIHIGNKACGDKHPCALYFHAQAAVKHLGNLGGKNLLVRAGLFQTLVASVSCHSLIGKGYHAHAVVELDHLCLHLLTHLGRQIQVVVIAVLLTGNHALGLVPRNTQDDLILADFNNLTSDNLSCTYWFGGFFLLF